MKNSYKIMAFVMLLVGTGSVFAAEQNLTEGVYSAQWLQEEIDDLVNRIEEVDLLPQNRENSALRARFAAKRGSYVRLLREQQRSGNGSSDGRNSSSLGRRSGSSLGRRSVSFSPDPNQIFIIPSREITVVASAPIFASSRSSSSLLPKMHDLPE